MVQHADLRVPILMFHAQGISVLNHSFSNTFATGWPCASEVKNQKQPQRENIFTSSKGEWCYEAIIHSLFIFFILKSGAFLQDLN